MKLTKAQRLFVAIGHADKRILSESVRGFMPPTQKKKFSIVKQELKQRRARRKKLIREALEAYETEKLVQQARAYERGFCDGLRINNTTKTQHT